MLRNLGSNKTQLSFADGTVVLFSYNTPVAAQLASGGFVRTSKSWSKTTSKHINQWLAGAKAREVSQSELDELVGGKLC